MKRRRETNNQSVKFEGSWKKFNSLLDIAELRLHEFLSEKNPSGLEAKKLPRLTIGDDQTPRKKRSSLREKPKKKIIQVSKKTQLVLPGSNVDWTVVGKLEIKEKEKPQKQQVQENSSSSSSSGEAVRLGPEIPDLNLTPVG